MSVYDTRVIIIVPYTCVDRYPIEVSATAALLNGGVDAEMIIGAPLVSSKEVCIYKQY